MSWFKKDKEDTDKSYSQVKEGYKKQKEQKIKKERKQKEQKNSSGNKNLFGD